MGINKVIYGGRTLIDISASTVTADTLAEGITAYNSAGELITGAAPSLFAAIGVTYSEGAVCTCTDGTKSYTARNTSGQAIFAVPYAGTWTVTVSDETRTKSETAEITTEGQCVILLLTTLYIYNYGDACEAISGGFSFSTTDGATSYGLQASAIYAASGWKATTYVTTNNYIDFTGYDTLYVTTSGYTAYVQVISKSSVTTTLGSGTGEMQFDISDMNGEYKVRVYVTSGGGNVVRTIYIYDIHLD